MATRDIQTRVSESVIGADGIISLKLFNEDPALYHSNAIAAPVDRTGYPGQTVDPIGSTILQLMDISTLRDADDGAGFYAAVRGLLSNWAAAVLFERDDDTADYRKIKTFEDQAPMGFTRTILASGPTTLWDYTNTVDVELIGGALVSLSAEEALNGRVAYLVGEEILLCQTVTQLSETRWRLAGPLVRGWSGTEWAVAGHRRNERFVVLSESTIRRLNDELSSLDLERYFKAVTAGMAVEDAMAQRFTDTGVSLKPWSPVDIAGSFDGSDNVVLTWLRRSRLRGRNGRDFYDPPLGEESESYEIDILADNELTVKRTLTATTNTVTYSNANQVTDFGATKEFNLHLNIYQMSADVGRGYAGHAVINPGGLDDGEADSILWEDGAPAFAEDGEHLLAGA